MRESTIKLMRGIVSEKLFSFDCDNFIKTAIISEGLRSLAMELDVPIRTASQNNNSTIKQTIDLRGLLIEKFEKPDEVLSDGTKIWENSFGECHRNGNKPAIIFSDGEKHWYKNGKLIKRSY